MSKYNTITSLAESPLQEGLIYAGTDDGLIQITEDGGENWRKIEVGTLPDVPETAFVNDLKADLFDANTVYIALDNHKYGDFNPYLFKSTDRGKNWKSIKGNIPEKTLVWRLVQDHINPDLMFLATEFGIYFTIEGGEQWVKLTGGVPTISFRDLAIQRRENDLVGASFGRSFYVFDDYSVLRHVSEEQLQQEATLFPPRDAWWYIERLGKGSMGNSFYTAPNPPYGAVFTYYLKDGYKTKKEIRQENEKKMIKENQDVSFPGWDEVEAERREQKPIIWLTIKDSDGQVVRRVKGPVTKGFHRVAWDLRYPNAHTIDVFTHTTKVDDHRSTISENSGILALPGKYTVSLSSQVNGNITVLSDPVEFEVKRMLPGVLPGAPSDQFLAFLTEIREMQKSVSATSIELHNIVKKLKGMQKAVLLSSGEPGNLDEQVNQVMQDILAIAENFYGNRSKKGIGDVYGPTVYDRLSFATNGVQNSTYGPTPAQIRSLEIAQQDFKEIKIQIDQIANQQLPALENELIEAGAPWLAD